jgi:hypothetical protein
MTAKGKINASNVTEGHRIIVNTNSGAYEGDSIRPSATKTGEGVVVTTVTAKLKCSNRRGYMIVTGVGSFYAEPIQTMWLAPEDAAGVKRAHAEAIELDAVYEAYPVADEAPAAEEPQEAPAADLTDEERAEVYNSATGTQDASAAHTAATAECENEWHRSAPVRALILCPECPTVAPAAADLLRLLEPEAGHLLPVRPEGRELVRLADVRELLPASLLTLHSQAGKVDTNSEDDNPEEPEMTATETAEIEIVRHTGSSVVALIEEVWDVLRAEHPELPAVVVTTGSGEGVKWGHFRPESWKLADDGTKLHEFFLASEALAKGATQVLQTTIHEAAHTLSRVRGIKDTSRQGRWHNAAFKKAAEELGLEHKASQADKSHGFSFVTLTQATKDKYADLLVKLERELKLTGLLPFWLGGSDEEDQGGEKITGKPKKTEGEEEGATKSGNLKATCKCEEPLIIRLSRKVLDLGVVRCDSCEELFTAA